MTSGLTLSRNEGGISSDADDNPSYTAKLLQRQNCYNGKTAVRLVFLFAAVCFAQVGFADCTFTLNCGYCNSGSFQSTCQCHDSSTYQCSGCTGDCLDGGCCCGHNTTGSIVTSCSQAGCGHNPTCTSRFRAPGGRNALMVASPLLMASSSVSLAGSALSALGALRQAGQPSPGTLSSDNTPIEIDVPPEAHIEITNIKLNATSTNFSGG